MKLVFALFILSVRGVTSQNLTEEILFKWNDTTIEDDLELTTSFAPDFNLTTAFIPDQNLTTSFIPDVSLTTNTTDIPIPEIGISPPVTRILSEIFGTYKPYCWRRSYGRGIGHPIHTCPDDAPEQDGLLCYPTCRHGYNGVGPVCWEKCDNITSLGFACVDIRLSQRSCPWYDTCGIVKRSCVSCPTTYTKLGCLCGRFYVRGNYGRGFGSSLICSKSYEQDGVVCYKKCDERYNGVGPVCWQHCPLTQPISCYAGCSKTKEICQRQIIDIVQSVIRSSIAILNVVIGIPFLNSKTIDILDNAAKGDWSSVVKDLSIIAAAVAKKVLPELANKFSDWSFNTVESAIRNASLIITATAMKNQTILLPLLKIFRLDSIDYAFNHGKCELFDNDLNK